MYRKRDILNKSGLRSKPYWSKHGGVHSWRSKQSSGKPAQRVPRIRLEREKT